ncbi:MAG: SCO family protein [Verrucomicrobiota bacterium]
MNTNAAVRSCCAAKEAGGLRPAYADKSLYQVESQWTTDGGKPIRLRGLAGQPQVMLMFFSKCTSACPILLNDLKRISAALRPEQRAQVGFTLVSFDTERDTPAALAEYRQAWDLPLKNWTLLSGHSDDVLELAALLGVKYRKAAAGQFAHSNVITVLNAKGEIVRQQIGLHEDIRETVQTLGKLVRN